MKKKTTDKITRKAALKKAGKYAMFTASATIMILSPKDAQAASEFPSEPGW